MITMHTGIYFLGVIWACMFVAVLAILYSNERAYEPDADPRPIDFTLAAWDELGEQADRTWSS